MGRKRKQQKSGKRKSSSNRRPLLKDDLKQLFMDRPEEAFSYRQVIKLMGIRDARTKDVLKDLLFSLENKGRIRRNRDGRWISADVPVHHEGVVDHVSSRFAYVDVPELEEDIYIKDSNLNFATDGDRVRLQVIRHGSDGFRSEGRVLSILERARDEFVGRIEISQKYAFVVPDNKRIHFDIFVHSDQTKKARNNDKVLAKIERWHDPSNKSPLGKVIEVLGPAGENEAEIHSIMAEYGLPFKFPPKVEKEAEAIPDQIDKQEYASRRDFREITTFTVDPEDAKDFDDALSIRELKDGRYEIGIHIADVSHYVQPKTALEAEALERATSVYLVDRTIPMLPEKLSNGLCSLRPNEEKLAFSAVFEMDTTGKVYNRWFGRTVILSDRRFTYEEAQERIEGSEGDFSNEVITLNALAGMLRDARFRHGAINFETVEVRFRLDEAGKPLEVVPKERKDAHKMIEEFMLLANREVATYIYNRKQGKQAAGSSTFVYRIHDDPDPEKLDNFSKFAGKFGHKLDLQGPLAKGLNKLMSAIEGKPEQNVLESIAIRAMAKARYTTEPKGHFGLAFDHYTHFTSPIRRYPDVMVHRLLSHYLEGEKSPDREPYEKRCIHSSEREKRAADAERASIKYKQVEFMTGMLGEVFEGIVSGVTEWGVFVEVIATKCEGMIRLSDIDEDYYEYDEKNFRVVGKRHKRIITLGDALQVQVVRTDIDRRTIDLLLAEEESTDED